jgi:crotonobetaine/carnitine-CoA ligase
MAETERLTTIGDAVQKAASLWPDKPAYVFDESGERLTFAEVAERSTRLANGLIALGVRAGDAVGVMLPNVPAYPLSWFALARIGARIVPLNKGYKDSDALFVLGNAHVVALVTDAERLPLATRLRPQLPDLRRIILDRPVAGVDHPDVDTLSQQGTLDDIAHIPATDDIVSIQYTSGTTGFPKGCLLDQAYWMTLARIVIDQAPHLTAADVVLTAQPFSYIDPHWNMLSTLLSGATLVALDGFHPRSFWQKIGEYDVTFFYCLGAMPTLMLAMPPSDADRAHKVRQVGCSAIPANRHAELEARFGAPWLECYGTTEAGAVIAMPAEDGPAMCGSGSMGVPLAGKTVAIVTPDGREAGVNERGELRVRGAGMMRGYFENEAATKAAFIDGWYATGDVVRRDERGYVYFEGRLKDMIRRGGENIAAVEVEEILNAAPPVQLCACVAVPDALRGEEVKVFVVLRPGVAATAETAGDIIGFANARLAGFKVPRFLEFVDQLPSTPSERVAKHALSRAPTGFDRTIGQWVEAAHA